MLNAPGSHCVPVEGVKGCFFFLYRVLILGRMMIMRVDDYTKKGWGREEPVTLYIMRIKRGLKGCVPLYHVSLCLNGITIFFFFTHSYILDFFFVERFMFFCGGDGGGA